MIQRQSSITVFSMCLFRANVTILWNMLLLQHLVPAKSMQVDLNVGMYDIMCSHLHTQPVESKNCSLILDHTRRSSYKVQVQGNINK